MGGKSMIIPAIHKFLVSITALFLVAFFSLHLSRHHVLFTGHLDFPNIPTSNLTAAITLQYNNAVADDESQPMLRNVSSLLHHHSVLLPDWEVLLIVPANNESFDFFADYVCLFQNNATSPVTLSGPLSTDRFAFKCTMPNSVRRLRPFLQPVMTKRLEKEATQLVQMPELYRWNFLVYESFSTENDVVLFAKGLNNRQGINRSPSEFNCVFYHDSAKIVAVKTSITSSAQEVFRCPHPNITAPFISNDDDDDDDEDGEQKIKVSIEIISENNLVVPSVTYYEPRQMPQSKSKSHLCASTMVYNAGKFLKEWVMYHSKIGVDKFILYDNDSSDDIKNVVQELNDEGFDVTTIFWVWPKTQEAGFSHSAVHSKDSCTWMIYVDVDEFIYSPSWIDSSKPSKWMLKSLLPPLLPTDQSSDIGQISIRCNEFSPSSQRSHPIEGVTQGYTCRRNVEQRHKSIVLLDAVDPSLLNAIHHFRMNDQYKTVTLSLDRAVVNHYKYQAWSEFQNKFRRRVSTYVVDWKEKANLGSNDRTPGLGFEAVEPEDWNQKFCEVRDERLKMVIRKWFGSRTSYGYKLAWQT
ncbi:glycosyltransferase family 92 protein Os08g0121900-like [Humulus lupulus]|uniref:glycosyltransferase family 92 protein Os08g0121900-like n=1 Tax=Humulus lupulus TaxID=3486 RepID=UPI002B40E070|nr:glycosyltransferase family 92 protein Os08g0121900-like [Humulus lupulus]